MRPKIIDLVLAIPRNGFTLEAHESVHGLFRYRCASCGTAGAFLYTGNAVWSGEQHVARRHPPVAAGVVQPPVPKKVA